MHKLTGFGFLVVSLALGASPARAEHTRVTNPNAFNVEFLGRGMLYSVNYDRVVNDDLVAGVGFGSTSMRNADGSDPGISTGLIPVFANYYFAREGGSFYGTAGGDSLANSRAPQGGKATFWGMRFNRKPGLSYFWVGGGKRSGAGVFF